MGQYYLKILFAALIMLCIPSLSNAHGGFEKRAGDTVVYITQSPISPYVGEEVHMNMVFQQYNSLDRWKNLDVQIKLIDSYYGDESKDKVILTTSEATDVNGSLNFSYTFPKENYFDVDVSFTNPQTGKREETGFLIQPRTSTATSRWTYALCIAIPLCGGVAVAALWARRKKGRRESAIL